MLKMTFVGSDSQRLEVDAPEGLTVLVVAHRNSVDIEGSCEGCMACSTCHIIVDKDWYEKLPEATEEEEEMLYLAFGIQRTSRLACQIIMTSELDGLVVALPPDVRNMLLE